jgi:hypothetical protein
MTGQPCTCPAYTDDQVGYHATKDHDYDCAGIGAETRCDNCWGCIADRIAYHQVTICGGAA